MRKCTRCKNPVETTRPNSHTCASCDAYYKNINKPGNEHLLLEHKLKEKNRLETKLRILNQEIINLQDKLI